MEMDHTKPVVAIVTGGDSPEREISLQTATFIDSHIDKEKYNVFRVEIKNSRWVVAYNNTFYNVNKDNFSISIAPRIVKFDCAVIAIHGTPGENGLLQAYFDLLQIPYTTCGFFYSALTFNKYISKLFVADKGFDTPEAVLIREGENYTIQSIVGKVGMPCFIKPNNSGSSCGISKIKTNDELQEAIDKLWTDTDEIIIERFIDGTELTCGVLVTRHKKMALPVTEVVSKNEFFDYQAKYDPEKADEITPARISESDEKKCKKLSLEIAKTLQCKGLVRVDFILSNAIFYFLEINTIPGMSANSIVPKQIKELGLSFTEIFSMIIDDAMAQKNSI